MRKRPPLGRSDQRRDSRPDGSNGVHLACRAQMAASIRFRFAARAASVFKEARVSQITVATEAAQAAGQRIQSLSQEIEPLIAPLQQTALGVQGEWQVSLFSVSTRRDVGDTMHQRATVRLPL